MKKKSLITFLIALIVSSLMIMPIADAKIGKYRVHGYVKKSGHYVAPYYRHYPKHK
jgi:hypothetical protein